MACSVKVPDDFEQKSSYLGKHQCCIRNSLLSRYCFVVNFSNGRLLLSETSSPLKVTLYNKSKSKILVSTESVGEILYLNFSNVRINLGG